MWVRTRLLARASYYQVINISHFNRNFALFCTVSHRLCANLHRASLGAPFNHLKTWSVNQHHCCMLQAIAALKFAQEVTINAKRFASVVEYQDQLASLSTATQIVPLFFTPTGYYSFFNSRKLLLSSALPILL